LNILWAAADKPEINASLGEWCAREIGLSRGFEQPYSTMGVFDGKELIAVVLYNNFQPEAGVVEFHGASKDRRWLTRQTLWEMFSYPFLTLGCQMAVTRNSERNEMWNGRGLHRMLDAYGFNHYRIPHLRGRDEAEIIWTLTDTDWLANGFHKEMHDGQERTKAA
jgi:hypothetical protein